MATVILLRHGRTSANATGILAGWTPDVHLDERGREQVAAAAQTIARAVTPARIVASPLVRCRETADAVSTATGVGLTFDDAIGECHYGAWTGRPIAELAKEPLWSTVQNQPSAVTFPPSDTYATESMAAMQVRAVGAIRRIDAEVTSKHGESAIWVAVSHGDVIKSIVADAAGSHLDAFQRITVAPASLSVIRYTDIRPYVLRVNDTAGGLADVISRQTTTGSDATVGGSTDADTVPPPGH